MIIYDLTHKNSSKTRKMMKMDQQQHFFDFAAQAGITKHLGGLEATDKLIELCKIVEGSNILDVGCGVGQTPCYIASRIGAKVTGIDINSKMIQRSKERAKHEGVEDQTDFRVMDAQNLLFPDNTFDAVITESVTAFPSDKQMAVREYARVTKKGGYIGLNESTWLKTPQPMEIIEWVSQEVGAQVKPQTPEEWSTLLENAGLTIQKIEINKIQVQDEAKGIIRRYGYLSMIMSLFRALNMYLHNPDYRRFVKKVQNRGITPPNLEECLGYGLFVARKKPYQFLLKN
jgi:ubiquinone/menaquinone biosynthesis C-methylase UbiE